MRESGSGVKASHRQAYREPEDEHAVRYSQRLVDFREGKDLQEVSMLFLPFLVEMKRQHHPIKVLR